MKASVIFGKRNIVASGAVVLLFGSTKSAADIDGDAVFDMAIAREMKRRTTP